MHFGNQFLGLQVMWSFFFISSLCNTCCFSGHHVLMSPYAGWSQWLKVNMMIIGGGMAYTFLKIKDAGTMETTLWTVCAQLAPKFNLIILQYVQGASSRRWKPIDFSRVRICTAVFWFETVDFSPPTVFYRFVPAFTGWHDHRQLPLWWRGRQDCPWHFGQGIPSIKECERCKRTMSKNVSRMAQCFRRFSRTSRNQAEKLGVKIILPVDFTCSSKFGEDGEIKEGWQTEHGWTMMNQSTYKRDSSCNSVAKSQWHSALVPPRGIPLLSVAKTAVN